ncbi:MAG: IPT/TIG domain-containing protein, partial [Minicystis sp.]
MSVANDRESEEQSSLPDEAVSPEPVPVASEEGIVAEEAVVGGEAAEEPRPEQEAVEIDAVLPEEDLVEDAVVKPALVEAVVVVDEAAAEAEKTAAEEAAAEELPEDDVEEAPPPPRILSIEPTHGPATGTTVITVNGEAFSEGCLVRFGTEDLHPSHLTPISFQLELPRRETGGYVDIRVVNPDQQNELRVNGYHYDPPPRVDRIEPDFCSPGGGANILVFGEDFGEGCTVSLGEVELPVFPQGSSKLEIVVPPRASGQFDIIVKNP